MLMSIRKKETTKVLGSDYRKSHLHLNSVVNGNEIDVPKTP